MDTLAQPVPFIGAIQVVLVPLLALCHGDNLFPVHQGGQSPLFSSPLLSFKAWDGL